MEKEEIYKWLIWDILKYEAFDEQVGPVILDRLIYDNSHEENKSYR
jgi:hypothetical protein